MVVIYTLPVDRITYVRKHNLYENRILPRNAFCIFHSMFVFFENSDKAQKDRNLYLVFLHSCCGPSAQLLRFFRVLLSLCLSLPNQMNGISLLRSLRMLSEKYISCRSVSFMVIIRSGGVGEIVKRFSHKHWVAVPLLKLNAVNCIETVLIFLPLFMVE